MESITAILLGMILVSVLFISIAGLSVLVQLSQMKNIVSRIIYIDLQLNQLLSMLSSMPESPSDSNMHPQFPMPSMGGGPTLYVDPEGLIHFKTSSGAVYTSRTPSGLIAALKNDPRSDVTPETMNHIKSLLNQLPIDDDNDDDPDFPPFNG